jgi:hypothetical protein
MKMIKLIILFFNMRLNQSQITTSIYFPFYVSDSYYSGYIPGLLILYRTTQILIRYFNISFESPIGFQIGTHSS